MIMHEYAIFVQARLGSTRFPKKILQKIAGKRVLDHVLDSCNETGYKVFLLTPELEKDFFVEHFNVEVFGGSENDVLSRFLHCAEKFNVKNIVRITSDCPCLPSSHISAVIEEHKKNQDKFVTNVAYENIEGSYRSITNIPDGFDVEVFSYEILKNANDDSKNSKDREHVTSWMRKNLPIFIPRFFLTLEGKFSLDTLEDLHKIEKNFSFLKSLKTIITL